MLKAIVLVLTGLITIIVIKNRIPEFSVPLRLTVICSLFIIALSGFGGIQRYIETFTEFGDVDLSYIRIAVKVTGICVISQLVSDVCRDCSESTFASAVELAGRVMIIIVTLPVLETLLEISVKMLS